jgi:hypothetical protein
MPPTATRRARVREAAPPHMWLADGRSLFDALGFEWTLLRLGPSPPAAGRILRAARESGIDLEAVDMPSRDARDLYEAPLALIRPDQSSPGEASTTRRPPRCLGSC